MIYDLQKASILKRISAWLLDAILLVVLAVGAAGLISSLTKFDSYSEELKAGYNRYEEAYGISFEITEEDYNALSQEERDNFDAAYQALIADEEVMYVYNMCINLTLLIVSLSILAGFLLMEFVLPLVFGNGQTIGKKVFGIAVMRTNGVRIRAVSLFIRTVLGKFTIETMIPVLVVIMLMFNVTGLGGTLIVLALGAVQLIMLCSTQTNSLIHDKLADTVAVDLASQMIFDTEEDLIEYKKRVAAENAEKKPYF